MKSDENNTSESNYQNSNIQLFSSSLICWLEELREVYLLIHTDYLYLCSHLDCGLWLFDWYTASRLQAI